MSSEAHIACWLDLDGTANARAVLPRLDALLQDPARTGLLGRKVIDKLESAQRGRREHTARKAAATKVQFFALATMRT